MVKVFWLLFSLLCLSSVWSVSQTLADDSQWRALSAQHGELRVRQDSLSAALVSSRKLFEQGDATASETIVRLEGEIYDLRAQISRISSRLGAIEQDFASRSLDSRVSPSFASKGFFSGDLFTKNLSKRDLARLSSAGRVEQSAVQIDNSLRDFNAQLGSLKAAYDLSTSQGELDRLRVEALAIKGKVKVLNDQVGSEWGVLYNYKLDTYLVLLDKLDNLDRSQLERLEGVGREVRRAEAFSQDFLNSHVVTIDIQRSYLHLYEQVIAKAGGSQAAIDSLSRLKPLFNSIDTIFDLNFDPRVLTVYSGVNFLKELPIGLPGEVSEVIIPERGVYYSVQIALMASAPKSLDMFKGAWPLQLEYTADGKFRYMVGGFSTYSDALKSVSALSKRGYRAPVMVAWVDGVLTSVSKAKAIEAQLPGQAGRVGSFKIDITTSDPSVADKLRDLVEMHAKGKSISRVSSGGALVFSVMEFSDRYQAEVLAHIVRERTGSTVEVVMIKQ